ncbi:aldo/keto reductase [Lacisediminimonas profundi]|uniref:aldo/keto reductase n=1 Tax=Lacisediminimonas profundi TaxID=2603856 RepID=UPI001F4F8C07|nr:aldo/keto reductase [Lacisediminimonas profundi]
MKRLALGTVQFGLPYGIANKSGQPGSETIREILETARRAGVDTLDTAIAYGDSERRLGLAGVGEWKVISKLPAFPDGADATAWVRESVETSLSRLRLDRLDGLLLHQPGVLLGPHGKAVHECLRQLKQESKIGKIGISVYGPEELDAILPAYPVDLVQAPFNIVDRRLLASGWLDKMHKSGIEIHVRSIFLQGLLLMSCAERPAKFQRWNTLWQKWDEWLHATGLSPLRACLGFALAHPQVSRVIVGVESPLQLVEILEAAAAPGPLPPPLLGSEDPDLINPSRWNSL